jgi:hypothetical protein
MPAKKGKSASAASNKRGRPPKKAVKKAPAKTSPKKPKPETHSEGNFVGACILLGFLNLESSDNNISDSLPAQNGSSAELTNNSENTVVRNFPSFQCIFIVLERDKEGIRTDRRAATGAAKGGTI